MLNRLTIKGRMFLIIGAIFIIFLAMLYFAMNNSNAVLELGTTKTGEVMLDDQKARVKLATHSMALALGHAIENMDDADEKLDTIRRLIDNVPYGADRSGYFFVYQNTTVAALPPKKALIGKDLGNLKDPNGLYPRRFNTFMEKLQGIIWKIATNISQASQGIQEVNQNFSQSATVASEITEDITTVNSSAGEISNSSSQVKLSAEDLQRMSAELNAIVGSFKI